MIFCFYLLRTCSCCVVKMCFVYLVTEEITIILGMECCWKTVLTTKRVSKMHVLAAFHYNHHIEILSSIEEERLGVSRIGTYRKWLNFIWLNSVRRKTKKRGFLSDFSRTWKLRIPGLLFQLCIAWVIWTLHWLDMVTQRNIFLLVF